MKRHTHAHVYFARLRAIKKWRRYRARFVTGPGSGGHGTFYHPMHDDFWAQENRFNKITLSCRDHNICRWEHYESQFAHHRVAFYRKMDHAHTLGWNDGVDERRKKCNTDTRKQTA